MTDILVSIAYVPNALRFRMHAQPMLLCQVVVFVPILIVAVGGLAALCMVQYLTPARSHPGNRYAASEHRSMKTPYDEMDNDTTGLLDSDW